MKPSMKEIPKIKDSVQIMLTPVKKDKRASEKKDDKKPS